MAVSPKLHAGVEVAGRSPVDRGKQGIKRCVVTDGSGLPLGAVVARANDHDSPLLGPTIKTLDELGPLPDRVEVHLDRGFDAKANRELIEARGWVADIAKRGVAAPLQAVGKRWVVERTHAWLNHFKKLSRCTEKRRKPTEFFFDFAQAIVVIRCLIREAKTLYR